MIVARCYLAPPYPRNGSFIEEADNAWAVAFGDIIAAAKGDEEAQKYLAVLYAATHSEMRSAAESADVALRRKFTDFLD